MKSLLNKILTIGALVTLGSVTLLSSGCGDLTSVDGQDCNQQSDCGSDGKYKCVPANSAQPKKFTCQLNCEKEQKADSSFCTNSESCTEFAGAKGSNKKVFACVPKAKTPEKCGTETCAEYESCNKTANKCEPKDCQTNPATACGTTGQCNKKIDKCEKKGATDAVKDSYKYIVIKDLTTDANSSLCTVGDAGSDITGISVLDSSGNIKGWAKGEGANIGDFNSSNAKLGNITYISGKPLQPLQGKDQCILDGLSTHEQEYVSLGCGGIAWFVLQEDKNPADVKVGDTIRVYEYSGKVCGTKSSSSNEEDSYAIYVCKSDVSEAKDLDEATKCKRVGAETNSVFAAAEVK